MHRSPFTRTKRRTRSWRLRPCRALKNWLSWHRSSRRRPRRCTRRRRSRRRQRRLVYRARAGLRHDHSRRWRNRSRWLRGRRALHLRDIVMRRRLRGWRSAAGWRCWSRSRCSWRNRDRRRCCTRGGWHRRRCGRGGWCAGNSGRNRDYGGWPVHASYRSRRHHSRCRRRRNRTFARRLGWHCLRRRHWSGRSFCLRFYRWHRNRRLDCRPRPRMLGCFL